MLFFIDWQPSVEAFSIGSYSVRWYGLLWCLGFLVAYLIVQRLYKQQKIADEKFEPLFFYCFLGVIIGARLGHCIFYEPQYYLTSLTGFIEMLIPFHLMPDGSWKFTGYEGLASHGGTIGLIIGMALYCRKTKVKPWTVMDNVAIAVPSMAALIRLGNLMNSEIIGNVTDVSWAFIFHSHEALVDGMAVPRHPAQLYEALAYLVIFVAEALIYWRWYKAQGMEEKSPIAAGTGFYFGFCLATIFVFRFFIEFLKKEQVDFEQDMLLDMGQLLSVPFVLLGVWCMIRAKRKAAS
ncbi:MAG: prolipoprotein diacylglyceryl transferase [Bacteroidaceae bacterium]|nr:prolipoprotein diacylglyceryl transferase [Bacteroidaceae bacterium]